MDEQLKQIQKLLDAAEGNLQSARNLLRTQLGGDTKQPLNTDEKLKEIDPTLVPDAIQGIFDGENMVAEGGKVYPVPANYASKSKLVEGDTLKLTIADDGSFIFKQISPVPRKNVVGTLVQADGGYTVSAEGKNYKVLTASVTFYKANPGDQVTVIVPDGHDAVWAAMENVIGSETPAPASNTPITDATASEFVKIEQAEPIANSEETPAEAPMKEGGELVIEPTQTAEINQQSSETEAEEAPAPPITTPESVVTPPAETTPAAPSTDGSPAIEFPGGNNTLSDDELLENLKKNLSSMPNPEYVTPQAAAAPKPVDNIVANDLAQIPQTPAAPASDQPIAELDI